MSLTLKDLLVMESASDHGRTVTASRSASLTDLVEVLKQEGAVEVRAKREDAWNGWLVQGSIPDPGRYLILPLEDTPK